MNLYKTKIINSNQLGDFTVINYVVAKSMSEVGNAYPKVECIELVSKEVTIL
ncbi:hypothetical protein [Maribacter sp.]|uniref:hypothetical protein n=1 Tax=Maribacter sp. TaxID=1897614 RepID=UPI0025BA3914|nr:hypothetical protein [Maribacter sp.]